MRYSRDHSEETRRKVVEAAGRAFRERGYDGIGVDGLAKAAGLTSGALYGHFRTKTDAFKAIVVAGLATLRSGIEAMRERHGIGWLGPFTRFYLGDRHRRDLAGGCALAALTAEVTRAPEEVRLAYEAELTKVADALVAGLPGSPARDAAWPILAQLAGGLVLARAVGHEALAREIAAAVQQDLQARLGAGDAAPQLDLPGAGPSDA